MPSSFFSNNNGLLSIPLDSSTTASFAPSGAFAQPVAGLIEEIDTGIEPSKEADRPDFSSIIRVSFITACAENADASAIVKVSNSIGFNLSKSKSLITHFVAAAASPITRVIFSVVSLALNIVSSASVAAADPTQPGTTPSTTDKFGLLEVGGQEQPGQCHTNVFLPASAVQFHTASAVQSRESKL